MQTPSTKQVTGDWGHTDTHTHTPHMAPSNGDKASEKDLHERRAGFRPGKQQYSQVSGAGVSIEKDSH